METCWIGMDALVGMDGVFVPMLAGDRASLEKTLLEYDCESDDERLEATHLFTYVVVPEVEDYDIPHEEYTWWDFGVLVAKQVDGKWFVWSEDVGSASSIWYQTTYTKDQAYGVRAIAERLASEGRVYEDLFSTCKTELMSFW